MNSVTERETTKAVVTISALLDRARAALASWRFDADHAAAEMAVLREAGVFMDETGAPVLPTWWERLDRPSRWLIWPAHYARRAGLPRRQRVAPGELEDIEAKRQRTLAYANAKERRDRLLARIEDVHQDLAQLAERYGW
jgi:hypothetical protein